MFVIGFGILWWNPVLARVSINPQLYDLSFSKALLAFHEGQYEAATAFLRDALEAKPGDPDASYYLGQALIRAQDYGEAEEIYRRLTDAEPSSGRARVGLAMAQYYQERYQDALSNLMTARTQAPSDPLAYYFEGLVYIRLNLYERADAPLTKALELDADFASPVRYQRGIAHYQLGRYEQARAEFEAVIAAEADSDLAQGARTYLAQLRDGVSGADRRRMDPTLPRPPLSGGMPKAWDLTFSVSPQYDSNVVVLPLGIQPPGGSSGISQKSDYRTVFTGRGEYRPLQTDMWTVGAAYGFYQSFHRTLSGFDVQDHTPSVYLQHQYGRVQSQVDYLFDYVTVGRDPFLVSNAVRPVISVREGDHWFTQVQMGYQNKDFKSDRFALNSFRDGKNWLVGISELYYFAEHAGVARIGYLYDTDRTGGGSPSVAFAPSNADWAYTGHRVSTGLRVPPIWTLTPDFTFDYYRQNYDNPNFFSTDPTNPALGGRTVRRDDIYMVTAGLSRLITQHLFLGVQYSYTRDKANISLFNYERMVYSISLSGSF